jgi:protein-S-isoprenylcysteine O-methyltransferase Ste14
MSATKLPTETMATATLSLTAITHQARPALDPPLFKWWVRARAAVAISLLAPVAIAAAVSPLYALPGTWGALAFNTVGWLLFFLGGGLRWWATLYIAHQKTRRLICDGPYSLCRNPIYLSNFLLALSLAAFLQSASFAVALLPVGAIYLYNAVRNEEERLFAAFGEMYLRYCGRVPRFVPDFRNFCTRTSIRLHLVGAWYEFRRTLRWIWIPIIGELILHLRAETWWQTGYWIP